MNSYNSLVMTIVKNNNSEKKENNKDKLDDSTEIKNNKNRYISNYLIKTEIMKRIITDTRFKIMPYIKVLGFTNKPILNK